MTPDATDPRQRSAALLSWTVASAAALAVPGVESISWFEASGDRGLRSTTGKPYPVEIALTWLAELAGSPMLEVAANTGSAEANEKIWALGARLQDSTIVLLANLRDAPASVSVTVGSQEQLVDLAAFSARRVVFR